MHRILRIIIGSVIIKNKSYIVKFIEIKQVDMEQNDIIKFFEIKKSKAINIYREQLKRR